MFRTSLSLPDKDIAHLRQECHDSKFLIFQEKLLKVLKCYNFLWVQWWNNCSPAASFANCVMTLDLLKVHLQTFLPIPTTQKFHTLSCDTIVANEQYMLTKTHNKKPCINYNFNGPPHVIGQSRTHIQPVSQKLNITCKENLCATHETEQ